MIFKLLIGFLSVTAFFSRQAFAAPLGTAGEPLGTAGSDTDIILPNPIGGCSKSPAEGGGLLCVAGNIIDALFKISIPIVAIMVLVGGFQIMTAGGNAEKVSSGRKTILYAAVGFVIVLLAESVVSIIQSVIGGGS